MKLFGKKHSVYSLRRSASTLKEKHKTHSKIPDLNNPCHILISSVQVQETVRKGKQAWQMNRENPLLVSAENNIKCYHCVLVSVFTNSWLIIEQLW